MTPPGYKQTEIGVIPEDWEVKELESVARIIDPQPDHRTPPETLGGEPYIGISDFIDDRSVDWDSSRKIVSKAIDKQRLNFQVGPGNIIFGKIGTIGSPKFLPIVPFRFGLSANVLLIQPKIEPNFVMAWLCSKPCQKAVISELHSTSQAAFGIHKMRHLMIPLPSSPEQRAIATALSDVDALLAALDRLIAKQRDLKQAAMQQLLTGQSRLPGFHEEWVAKRLGEVVQIQKGQLITAKTLCTGDVPVIAGGKQPAYFHAAANRNGRTITISASGASAGYVARYNQPIFASDCSTIGESADYSLDFVFYQLLNQQQAIYKAQTGGAQPHIHAKDLNPLAIPIPPLPEQTAIASVLSEMDAELAALEQRRDKTRALKQGMMQELLTGRTRLI